MELALIMKLVYALKDGLESIVRIQYAQQRITSFNLQIALMARFQ